MRRGQKRGLSSFAVGAIVLTVAVVLTYLGFTKSVPFRSHDEIKAAFTTSNNLRLNSPVRIAGVNVGKVSKIEQLDGGRGALVTMRIDKKGMPIHKDATARIRPRIFLEGNFFVDIAPGSASAPELHDGEAIPIQQTSSPVQLDQVLTALQADTRKELQSLLRELSSSLKGRGAEGYNRSQKYWKPAYRDGAIVANAATGQLEHDLSGYVKNAGATAEALTRNSVQLKSLITDFNTTAGALADRSAPLERAVAELPRTLRAGMPALAALNAAFPPLRRLIRDLRPGVRSSAPTLRANLPLVRELRGLLSKPELRGLVSDLRPTVPALAKLNRATIPLMSQTRLASSCQNEVILPWTKDKIEDKAFPAVGPVYDEAPKAFPGLAGESRVGDANGQWFRVLVGGGLFSVPNGNGGIMLNDSPLLGANPPPGPRPPLKPDVPCETQEQPDLRTIPAGVGASHRAVVPESKQDDMQRLVARAVKQVRGELKDLPARLRKGLTVSSKPATKQDLALARALRDRLLKGKGR
ncbi:MAG TPA: MlaD family protein [Solirubrobacteraceae bacterium]